MLIQQSQSIDSFNSKILTSIDKKKQRKNKECVTFFFGNHCYVTSIPNYGLSIHYLSLGKINYWKNIFLFIIIGKKKLCDTILDT